MSRVLIAGIGNVFLGDDGFGCEVARHLLASPLPGAQVVDFGIRGLHLAFTLLEPFEKVVVIDTVRTGQPPGTLSLIAPSTDTTDVEPDAHGMHLPAVIANVRMLGGRLPPIILLGCEPLRLEEGMGLSPPVAASVAAAVRWARELSLPPVHPELVEGSA
jgi:hydrogenase maturation protease